MSQSTSFNTLTKSDLVNVVAQASGLPKNKSSVVLDALLKSISQALSTGQSVSLIGFGVFEVKERAAREGRNPRTGESISIAAVKVPQFKPGKGLRDAVNHRSPAEEEVG